MPACSNRDTTHRFNNLLGIPSPPARQEGMNGRWPQLKRHPVHNPVHTAGFQHMGPNIQHRRGAHQARTLGNHRCVQHQRQLHRDRAGKIVEHDVLLVADVKCEAGQGHQHGNQEIDEARHVRIDPAPGRGSSSSRANGHASETRPRDRGDEGAEARPIAEKIEALNLERRKLQRSVEESSERLLAEHPEWLDRAALIMASPEWHPSVLGVVASGYAERIGMQCALLCLTRKGQAQAQNAARVTRVDDAVVPQAGGAK